MLILHLLLKRIKNSCKLSNFGYCLLQNPSLWCDEAFRKANVVVVVSSPPKTDYSYSIYTSAPQAHRLIEENYPRNDKKYVAVLLPYCSREDIPPVARKFRRVRLPQQCKKLLIRCHKTDYTNMFHDWKNNQELIKSIEIAELEIRRPRPISDSNNRNESNGELISIQWWHFS